MEIRELYKDAMVKKYAVNAYNFTCLEVLKGIINGCEQSGSPIVACMSESALKYMGANYVKQIIKETKKITSQSCFFHLDHGKTFEICKTAISLGFDSVMIDGSSLDFEENIKLTKIVVEYAHKKNIWVEAELGCLKGVEDEVVSNQNLYTNPQQAQEFVKRTNCDSLAIAIGTSHGVYKFKGEPKLKIDILQKIQNLLPNYPLVLHGASSINTEDLKAYNKLGGSLTNAKGLSNDIIKQVAKKSNIVKINCDSDLRLSFSLGLKTFFSQNPDNIDIKKYLAFATDFVSKTVEQRNSIVK